MEQKGGTPRTYIRTAAAASAGVLLGRVPLRGVAPETATSQTPANDPAVVAYFGPDLDDPAVRRRVAQWRHAGFEILVLAFSRRKRRAVAEEGILALGRIAPRSRLRRILPLLAAGFRLITLRRRLAQIDLFVARNLDNALLALLAHWIAGSSAPLVYEVLDVNPSFTGRGWQASLLRALERRVLSRIDLLVVSSPYFITAYYQDVLRFRNEWVLFENKMPKYVTLKLGLRDPAPIAAGASRPRRWRIGWFGYLDDERSWHILRHLASELPEIASIHVRGMPYTDFDMKSFLADVAAMPNVAYGGPFRNPEDLAAIYDAVDIVWSADCNALSANSKWLLTNGIYEAGYFGKPVIGIARTAVGEFLAEYRSGWCLAEPIEDQLVALVRNLTAAEYEEKKKAIAALHTDRFVESDEIETICSLLGSPCPRRSAGVVPEQLERLP